MNRKRQAKDIRQPSEWEPAQGSDTAAPWHRRIRHSASGLLKESFELPSPRAVNGILASIDTNNTKSGPSSNTKGVDEASLAFSSSSQSTLHRGEAFRSNQKSGTSVEPYGQVAFDHVLEGPTELELLPNCVQERAGFIGDKQEGLTVRPAEDDLRPVQERETWKRKYENQDFKYETSDGAAVVALLSDPAFMVDEEPSSTLDPETNGAEGQIYKRLQTGKGVAETGGVLHTPSRLGLIPDFGAPWNLSDAFSASQKRNYERRLLLESEFCMRRHLLESKSGEVQPWIDIVDGYVDEVWGEMLPPVQEAREELTAASESQTYRRDDPAIRRLKMVLKHLDNRKSG